MQILLFGILLLFSSNLLQGQEIYIGFRDTIESSVMEETRSLMIGLPESYDSSQKNYPVVYRLDGDRDLFFETMGIIHRLTYMEELMPEVIVVTIENTDRVRDMMPVQTGFFQREPGAERFREFIELELFPHISSSYRVTDERILCGQSLSSIFTLYCLLTDPGLFDSYIAGSAGFPGCESYFMELTRARLATGQEEPAKVFITYGEKDPLDPDGVMGRQLADFTELLVSDENIHCRYKSYPEEGHVPFQGLYHGLKFIYKH